MTIFEGLAEAYSAARKPFPFGVMYEVCKDMDLRPHILDIGCGTGISTRQLSRQFPDGRIYGCDIDKGMIRKAKDHANQLNTTYLCQGVNDLSDCFSTGKFHLIAAFSSFHWFCNLRALRQISTVLAEDGRLVIVNKWDNGAFAEVFSDSLEKVTGQTPRSLKKAYRPKSILEQTGWQIHLSSFEHTDLFSVDDAVKHSQSRHAWGNVSSDDRLRVEELLREGFEAIAENGVIARPMVIRILTAHLPIR